MTVRDHKPIILKEFNGLWDRGDIDTTPNDHFSNCNNIKFVGPSSFGTRDGIGISQSVALPLSNVKRLYNYPMPTGNTIIALTVDGSNVGKIYHYVNSTTIYGPVLTITGMTDFGFVPYAGRGYITPFTTSVVNGLNVETGMQSQFLYVYAGDGTAARQAAGAGPAGTLTIANGAAGHTDNGFKLFGVVFEYDSGYLSPPGEITSFTTSSLSSVSFSNVVVGGAHVVKRHLVSTITINNYNGDTQGYQFFFVPNAIIADNSTTVLNNISFYDADLISDASHLLDNFTSIPAGVGLTLYHNRLVIFATYTDISLAYVSAVGEPEAISQIDGILIIPPDGNPITNAQEMRDVLYLFKRDRTVSFVDNGDVPSNWQSSIVDLALGTPVHGIATVIDSGSTSTDYLIICTYQGVSLFNGRYITPELTWKINNRWSGFTRNDFRKIQVVNSSIRKEFFIVMPDGSLLYANYQNGLDPKRIRWAPWTFPIGVNSIALVNIDDLIIGTNNS